MANINLLSSPSPAPLHALGVEVLILNDYQVN